MAKVTGPLFSVEGTGKLGEGICFTRSLGGARVILNPTHKDAYSAGQSIQRSSFITGKSMWKALSAASKAYYNTLAADLKMTGYNFYLKKVLLGQIGGVVWVNDSIALQVTGTNDDTVMGYDSGAWWIDNLLPTHYIGSTSPTSIKTGGGLRFLNCTIPVGATILTAHIHLTCDVGNSSSPVHARIVGNKEVNPAGWTTLANYQSRRGTDAGGGDDTKRTVYDVQWALPSSMIAETEYETPDITTVLQELINQAGYASGQAVVFFVDDHKGESSVTEAYSFYSRNGSSTKCAKLHVTYKYIA